MRHPTRVEIALHNCKQWKTQFKKHQDISSLTQFVFAAGRLSEAYTAADSSDVTLELYREVSDLIDAALSSRVTEK